MASERDHILLANRNHKLLMHLLGVGEHREWVATVAFYKAVHVVEAVFAKSMSKHSTDHGDRLATLTASRFKPIFRDYKALYTASLVARYLSAADGSKFHQFSDYMGEKQVKDLIRKRLYGVEQNSLAALSQGAKDDLLKIDPSQIS